MKKILSIVVFLFLFCLVFFSIIQLYPKIFILKKRTPEIYLSFPPTPPSALTNIIDQATAAFNTPSCVLEAVAWVEGGHLWNLSAEEIQNYSQPGGKDPANCLPNTSGAQGPMQFTGSQWNFYKTASGRSNPQICNIYDSLFSASAKLAHDSDVSQETGWKVTTNNWTDQQINAAIFHYYGACHDCGANPSQSSYADCRRLNMSYCEYVLNWCRGSVPNQPSLPSGSSSSPNSSRPSSSCSAGKIDLLNYYLPQEANKTVEIHHYNAGGQETGTIEFFHTYSDIVSNGKNGFYFVKSKEAKYFEEFSYDDDYIYHLKDTTWATGPNQNVTCNDTGDEAFSTGMDGALGPDACSQFIPENEGGKIVRRCMSVGEVYGPADLTILGFSKISCECCPTNYSGNLVQKMTFVYQGAHTFPNGWHSDDLIILQAGDGGEKYFIDKRYGFVGFEGAGFRSYPVAVEQSSRQVEMSCILNAEGIILSQMGGVRSNWTETSTTETKKPVPVSSEVSGAVLGLFSQLISGKVFFKESEPPRLPGITVLKDNFLNAFNSLLPEKKAETASLPGTTELKTVTSVFPMNPDTADPNGSWTVDNTYEPVCYNGAPRPEEDVAKEQTTVPSSWGQFVGSAVAVAGLGLPTTRLTDLSLYEYFRYQFPKIDWQCLGYSFGPGPLAAPKATVNTKNIKPEFRVTLTAIIEEILDTVKQVLNIKETKKVEIRVNTQLAGVGNARDKSKEVNQAYTTEKNFKELNQVTSVRALAGDLKANVIMSPSQEGSHQLDYYDFLPIRNNACFPVCGAYTQKRVSDGSQEWVGQEKFCPSCNPEDYKAPFIPIPKPDNLPDGCHWDYVSGCDYYDCVIGETLKDETICQRSCELDPVCESGLCTKNKLYTKPFLPDGTYCANKQCKPGQCHWEHYDRPSSYYYPDQDLPESGPPWGPRYTKNPDVCTGGDIGCNPDCCQGS